MRILFLVVVLAIALPALFPSVSARLIRVPYDYPRLYDACNAAYAGDTVGVYAGTHTACLVGIRPGVTVRGMEPDSTAVRVFPSADWCSLFCVLSGVGPVVVEKMELHGGWDLNGAVLANANPHTIIQRCLLYVVIDNDVSPPVVGAAADLTVRQCDIFDRGVWYASLLMTYGSPTVRFEDCVIDLSGNAIMEIGPGTVIELKNNTFQLETDLYISSDHEYSMFIVNNIFRDGARCFVTAPVPDVLEWRYNDFLHYAPDPGCGYQVGNFSADPLFCDAGHGDYRLQPKSPCIGTGENGEDVGARRGICWPTSVPSGEGALRGELRITCIRPNPTSGGVTIELTGGTGEAAGAQILDPAGRVVRTVSAGRLAGRDLLGWDGCREDGRRVPPGVYYVRLTEAGRSSSARVLIVR
jgi:hypothetical protein